LAAAVLWLAAPTAQAATDLLPDLVPEPPAYPQQVRAERLADGRDHLLVRFDGWIHNVGAGPVEIRGSQPVGGEMTVTAQRIHRTDSSFRDDTSRHPQLHYENTDGHRHWHLRAAARYSLWNESATAQVAPSAKVGFCLLDSEHVDGFGPSAKVYTRTATQYCGEGQPNVAAVFEGISRGWRDYYPGDFPFQWVDVSDVAPGRYRLGAEVDPENFVLEGNDANNGPALGPAAVTVPGWVASPVTVTGPLPQVITLPARPYGGQGPPVFRIESAPSHGMLGALAGSQVTYTPGPGFAGNDSFVYSVRDSSSPYPLHASAGAVTVTVPSTASRHGRARLLTGLRFSRRGRFLRLRAHATRSGVLRVVVKKRKRRLGSCRKRARSGHRFSCRMKLRRHARPNGGRLVVTLLASGKASAVDTYRVPRRIPR
jgi:hypothetical protein